MKCASVLYPSVQLTIRCLELRALYWISDDCAFRLDSERGGFESSIPHPMPLGKSLALDLWPLYLMSRSLSG